MNPVPIIIMGIGAAVGWLVNGANGAVAGFAITSGAIVVINVFL